MPNMYQQMFRVDVRWENFLLALTYYLILLNE